MKYLALLMLIACKQASQPSNIFRSKDFTITHCHDFEIHNTYPLKDSIPDIYYYFNIDWQGRCARVVSVLNDKKDTLYLYDNNFDCPESKDINKERLKQPNNPH